MNRLYTFVALAVLASAPCVAEDVWDEVDHGFAVNDGKHATPNLAHLGFKPIPRAEFNALLATNSAARAPRGRWQVDETLDVGKWDPKAGPAPVSA